RRTYARGVGLPTIVLAAPNDPLAWDTVDRLVEQRDRDFLLSDSLDYGDAHVRDAEPIMRTSVDSSVRVVMRRTRERGCERCTCHRREPPRHSTGRSASGRSETPRGVPAPSRDRTPPCRSSS